MNLQRLVDLMSSPVGLSECEAELWIDRLAQLIDLDTRLRVLENWERKRETLLPEELLDYLVERGVGRWWDHGDLSPGQRRFVSKWLPT